MMQPYSAQDYAAQLAALLPQGPAWPREPDTVLARLLDGLAEEPARVDAAAHALLTELDPQQALELLEAWERMCGLPDGCSQPGETIAERREAVVLRLSAQGGQTPAYFAEVATLLAGAMCTVREYRPFRAGRSSAGDPLSNGDWPHAFTVQAPETPIRVFRAGQSAAGEPLRKWGNERLECTIRRLSPAQAIVTFTYGT
ncbi:MAG: YmfQ family protein [Humidesulfovibrio sp.]